MHQRAAAKAAWQAAGLYQDAKLTGFLDAFEGCQADCWPALAAQVRDRYARQKRKIAAALWDSGDKLLRLNLIRTLDPGVPDELNLMKRYLRSCDPAADGHEIRAFTESGDPGIVAAARKKAR
jgi:hypothetical protein